MVELTAWDRGQVGKDDSLLDMTVDQEHRLGRTPVSHDNEYHTRIVGMDVEGSVSYGHKLIDLANSLAETVSTLTANGSKLSEAWGGKDGHDALKSLGMLRTAVVNLAAAVGTVGEGVRWIGEDVIPAYQFSPTIDFTQDNYRGIANSVPVIWDHEVGADRCDCDQLSDIFSSECTALTHVYHYEYSGVTISGYYSDELRSVSLDDLLNSELGQWVNETERQAIEDRKLDVRTIYNTAIARQEMDRLNGEFEALHKFLPEAAVCTFPDL